MIVMLWLLQNHYNIMNHGKRLRKGGNSSGICFIQCMCVHLKRFFISSSHVLNSMYIFVVQFLIILKDIQDTEAATGDVL